MYRARIEVSLKPGHSDPEGEMTAQSLKELKFSVKNVNVSKVYMVVFEAESKQKAEEAVEEMCRKLLANPTKDNYSFKVEEEK
ncbi:MAG: phosphoribosylformylglycinamidine synthase subunit PurS [Candidatus Bathyarchaeota archaeon]|nr:phosphoribosylformylglycinamidine synthase subunit PurS [Candidatus Bathyarchaeum tardum]WGM89564.1 MAG: phosphoribosylformylglycinamidine synthase subunit PurS [Candidatus Bathyarchaeum tardum]WNZ30332.1 MAG: phosphoribosylformylglycinamidine synthase subunit PurS [Candidatus Bathyarchaeota archaeon]